MKIIIVKLLMLLASGILLVQVSSLSQRKKEPHELCLEDMCVRPELQIVSRKTDPNIDTKYANPNGVDSGCTTQVTSDSRLLLLELTPPFHGSTALEGVLMGSEKLATLCPYNMWECEGREIMFANGYQENDMDHWNYTDMLKLFSEVWDLNKPVVLEKNPLQIWAYKEEDEGLRAAPMPKAFVGMHINKLNLIYILMWRPYCLGMLSSSFRGKTVKAQQEDETNALVQQTDAHKYLTNQGTPVLVVNFADLIWQPSYTLKRLHHFLPCLGELDIDYVPKLGKDIFHGNQWKADGSVREFGLSADPWECCGFNLTANTCTSKYMPKNDYLRVIHEHSEYLDSYS